VGSAGKLDRIIFRVYERSAQARTRWPTTRSDSNRSAPAWTCSNRPGIPGRRAATSERLYSTHVQRIAGAICPDVSCASDREGIDRRDRETAGGPDRAQRQPAREPHLFVRLEGHRDNSDTLRFEPAAANRELDKLGWVRPAPGATRRRGQGAAAAAAGGYANRLATDRPDRARPAPKIGVGVGSSRCDRAGRHPVQVGQLRLVSFAWQTTATPFTSSEPSTPSRSATTCSRTRPGLQPEITALFRAGIASWTTPSAPTSATRSTSSSGRRSPLPPTPGPRLRRPRHAGQLRRPRVRRHRLRQRGVRQVISRRQLMQGSGLLAATAVLAACSGGSS